MIVEPMPIIVTVFPEIVATRGLLLVYVNSPPLLDTGAVKLNGKFSNDLLEMVNCDSQGAGKHC